MKELMAGLLAVFAGVALIVAAAYGWVMNLVAIAHGSFDPLTGMMVLRVVGVIIAPVGVVLGYIP